MNRSREDSPDWLRSFQAPTSNLVLSSDSDSLPNGSPVREDNTNDEDTILHNDKVDQTPSKKKQIHAFKKHQGSEDSVEEMSEKGLGCHVGVEQTANRSIWTLSSDSESSPKRKEKGSLSQESGETSDLVLTGRGEKSSRKKTSKGISPKKKVKTGGQTPTKVTENDGNVETAEEVASEKNIEPHVSTSRLPLVLSEKVQRSKGIP